LQRFRQPRLFGQELDTSVITRDLLLATLALLGGLLSPTAPLHAQPRPTSLLAGNYRPSYGKLRDTLFILDTTYLEVRLDRQMIYQHFRSGRIDSYPCSTGDPRIEDGIATRPGIFTIQGKAKKTLSQQFQVYLNYWMQFDGGIGFHGLQGHSYYRFLGHRASSHGCVRISNESGAQIFKNVSTGTVVFVHSGSPARILSFADSSLAGLRVIYEIDEPVFKQRLNSVIADQWEDSSLTTRLALAPRKRLSKSIAVGSVNPNRITQYRIPIIEPPFLAPRPTFPVSTLLRPFALNSIPGQEDETPS
jgi:hypothetical protein